MTRAASEKAKSNLQVEAPIFTGLPSWIDPEKSLPADHPLRLVKKSMEIGCHEAHPNWSFLAVQTQAEVCNGLQTIIENSMIVHGKFKVCLRKIPVNTIP